MRLRPRTSILAVVAIVSLATAALVPLAGTASAHAGETSTCRASVLRLRTPLGTIEPTVVQNAAGQSCTAQSKNLVGPIVVPGLISISVGNAKTVVSGNVSHARSTAQLVNLSIAPILTLPAINVSILVAETFAGGCQGPFGKPGSKPLLSSSGKVTGLTIGRQAIGVNGNPLDLNLFIATLSLNKVTVGATGITRQAFVLNVPLLGISLVISEAQSGFAGNPCDG